MSAGGPLAAFVASDATMEDALPFLAAFRETNPRLPLLMIPRDAEVAELSAFRNTYGFDILERDFAAIDLLEDICLPTATSGRGRLRLLAAFDLAGPVVVCADMLARLGPLDGVLARLSARPEPTAAVRKVALLAVGGPQIGSARLIRAVRENLVVYFRRRAPDAEEQNAVLTIGLDSLGVNRIALDDVAVRTCDSWTPIATPELASLQECSRDVTILDNGGAYRRSAAKVLGAPDGLARDLATEAARHEIAPPPGLVGRLRHATVHGRGIVVTETGRVVRESLLNAGPDDLPKPLRRRPVAHRDGAGPVVLLKQTWDPNYGHWLVESLPRVELVAECHDLSMCRFLIGPEPPPIGQVYRDTLHLLGIDESQIVAAADETRFCADLIYPAPLTVQPWVKAPRVIRFLERLGARVPGGVEGPERIYVSRNRTARRRLRNEQDILPLLAARGYVAVEPQFLDFARQVGMFRNARQVVGNLGAALVNVAFAPRGLRVLALATEFMQDDFFWDLVSQRDGQYVSLHGRAADPEAGMQSDFDIDPDLLRPLLDALDGNGGSVGPGSAQGREVA